MRKVALRGIRANLGRSIMAIVAVVLGVAFMTGTLGLSASLDATFQGIADTWNHYEALVVGANETSAHGRNHISADLREQIMAVEGVADTATAGTVPLVLIGADRTPVQSTMAPSMAMSALAAESSGEVTDGRLPERPGEMAVEASTLASSGLAVGDTATVILSGQNQDKTIVGEVTLPNPQAGATMVFLEPAFADNLVVVDGLVPHFAVWGEPGVGEEVLVERIASALAGASPPIAGQAGEYVPELNPEAGAESGGMIGTVMTLVA
ncbi:MAG: ABC transporter permease, partial [Promicromonosporaceae bacterium]|nr:ABC transporter permease [Promicromonosporaceae bacterium]